MSRFCYISHMWIIYGYVDIWIRIIVKFLVLAYSFKPRHILYLLNLKDICVLSHLIIRSWLDIHVRILLPGHLFMEMQYFQAEFEFFTNLNPNVPPMEKPGSLYAKNVKKLKLKDWNWTALSLLLSNEIN